MEAYRLKPLRQTECVKENITLIDSFEVSVR